MPGAASNNLLTARRIPVGLVLMGVCTILCLSGLAATSAVALRGSQTVDECRKCCEKKDYDDYYTEQCRLRCFRYPDSCDLGDIKKAEQKEEDKPDKPTRKKPRRKKAKFKWPDPLNLTPGKEWEAAAQILGLNRMTTDHPNYKRALREMEIVLKQFIRQNPQGGRLPTKELSAILNKYRRVRRR